MLSKSEILSDNIRRVIVSETLLGTYFETSEVISYFPPLFQLCVIALRQLTASNLQFWFFGEEDESLLLEMKQHIAEDLKYKRGKSERSIFIGKLEPEHDYMISRWPVLRNEYSTHIFATKRISEIQSEFEQIFDHFETNTNIHCLHINEIIERCCSRDGISEYLNIVPIVMIPDGNLFRYPSIHTRDFEIKVILDIFEKIADTIECECNLEENLNLEYTNFFQKPEIILYEPGKDF